MDREEFNRRHEARAARAKKSAELARKRDGQPGALRILCPSCGARLVQIGRDAAGDLWIEPLHARMRGRYEFQADREQAGRVHKVIAACWKKGCAGRPQVTVARLDAELDQAVGRNTPTDIIV